MLTTRLVMVSLWITAPLNLIVAAGFAFPGNPVGALLQLPQPVPSFYAWFTGAMIALFGCCYGWMAVQQQIIRSLLLIGALGKTLAVILAVTAWAEGHLPALTATLISGDLLFAGLWFYYLLTVDPGNGRSDDTSFTRRQT